MQAAPKQPGATDDKLFTLGTIEQAIDPQTRGNTVIVGTSDEGYLCFDDNTRAFMRELGKRVAKSKAEGKALRDAGLI